MEIYLRTDDAWRVMGAACETAVTTIDFEQYIVRDDDIGVGFLKLLAKKAREGVRVRIILDAFGSRTLVSHPVMDDLRAAGVQVAFYHHLRPRNLMAPRSWFPRTHAKLLHIDSDCSFLGSMCLAAYMSNWRDTMIRLPAGLLPAARNDFERLWQDLGDGILDGDGCATVNSGMTASYAAQNPLGRHYPVRDALLAAVDDAKENIWLATPYFFPPLRLERALQRACRRGVKVTLLLSARTDVAIADRMTVALLGRWRRHGYDVYLYEHGVMHAKYAIIDDNWGTAGSCNFDYLGLCYNREANIILQDPEAIAQLRSNLDQDMDHAAMTVGGDRSVGAGFKRLIGRLCFAFMRLLLR